MKNYELLSKSLFNFINVPKNLDDYVPKKTGHTWLYHKIGDFLSDDGIRWFRQRGIILRDTCMLFSINGAGEVHSDYPLNYSINFVLKGNGKMEWIKYEKQSYRIQPFDVGTEIVNVPVYDDIDNYIIEESLDDSENRVFLVRVDKPHRIVSDEPRLCLAIRPTDDFNYDFNEVRKLFN